MPPKNTPPPALFDHDEPRWHVVTRFRQLTKKEQKAGIEPEIIDHDLRYGSASQLRKKGERGLESLREMAKFLNRRRMKPRPRIECAADAPSFDKYLKDSAP